MRLVKISAPEGKADQILELAFSVGIRHATKWLAEECKADGSREKKEIIDIQSSTPQAKLFIDRLLAADFYNRRDFSIAVRQPRSIISAADLDELTKPLVTPAPDILTELWQFSRITVSFAGRFFIAGGLLAFGLINQNTLLIIAGLLFLPLLPLLLAIGFGCRTRQWKLAIRGAGAFCLAIALLMLAGIGVAFFAHPPLKYDEFNSLTTGVFISLAVGVAAVLANVDDVGRRELIGLAATAQLAILPVWFGICLIFSFPVTLGADEIFNRGAAFFINAVTIILASLLTYTILSAANSGLKKVGASEEK